MFLAPQNVSQKLEDMWTNALKLGSGGNGGKKNKRTKIHLSECLDGVFNILKCR